MEQQVVGFHFQSRQERLSQQSGGQLPMGQGGDFLVLFQTGFFTTQSGTLVNVIPSLGIAFAIAPITG